MQTLLKQLLHTFNVQCILLQVTIFFKVELMFFLKKLGWFSMTIVS